jgi:hypothetical protein
MTVVVSFCKVRGVRGNSGNPAITSVRVREDLDLGDVSTATVAADEIVLVGNGGEDMIAAAFGTTPDADAAAATSATTAGAPVPAGQVMAFAPAVGSKVSVKAL